MGAYCVQSEYPVYDNYPGLRVHRMLSVPHRLVFSVHDVIITNNNLFNMASLPLKLF